VKKIILFLVVAVTAHCMSVGLLYAADEKSGSIVKEIIVLGNRSVDDAVILSRIKTKVGGPFSQNVANYDLRRLYTLGYFVNISIDIEDFADGVKVAFIVREKPFLKDVVIQGNKVFKTDKIMEHMKTKVHKILDEANIKKDMQAIRKMYEDKGYYSVKLSYKVSINENTGRAILFITIIEGKKMYVKKVSFEGVTAFKDKQIRKLMKTKPRWFFRPGYLKEDIFRDDLDRIQAFYVSKGYIDMKIKDVKRMYKEDNAELYITISIDEGQQYIIDKIMFKGNKKFPTQAISTGLKMHTGKTFIPSDYRNDLQTVENFYFSKGYIDAKVRSDTVIDYEAKKLDISYSIQEDDISYIEKIDIRGNLVTKDKVIRREILAKPGQKFDSLRIKRSQQRLQNLNYFKNVSVDYEPTGIQHKKNLVFTVEEKKTGELSFGAGFSSIDSLVGFAEVSQSNFDFMNFPTFVGSGQKMRLRVEAGNERQEGIISFTEPYMFDRRIAGGFDAYVANRTYLSSRYDEQKIGFDLRAAKSLMPFLRGDLIYTLEEVKIDVDEDSSDELKREDGTRSVSKVTGKLDYDTRDSFFFPTKGFRVLLIGDIAGLGGTTNFAKCTGRFAQYFSFFDTHVLRLVGELGIVQEFGSSEFVPIFDRYFMGGANSVRGFKYRKVGPKDSFGEPIGGNVEIFKSAEYSFPIISIIRGAFFFDTGNVFRTTGDIDLGEMNGAIGCGVRLNLPVGPVQLDYGYPVYTDKETKQGNGEITFNMGTRF